MKVVSGSASRALGARVAAALGAPEVPVAFEKNPGGFPDGEQYVRLLGEVRGEDAVLVAATWSDPRVVEILLLQDALREAGARRVLTVIPYFAYFRQDKVFEAGEALSARALARAVGANADLVLTVGLHDRGILQHFPDKAEDVSGMPAVASFLKDLSPDLVLSPDHGAVHLAREVGEILGVPFDHLDKKRIDAHTVTLTPKALDVAGKRVALVDDVISTGGTIALAAKHLKGLGATRVSVACLHGVFAGSALDRLAVCDDLAASDTIESPRTKFSVGAEVARGLRAHV